MNDEFKEDELNQRWIRIGYDLLRLCSKGIQNETTHDQCVVPVFWTYRSESHCLGTLAWIKKSSLSRDHNCDQIYAFPD